MDVTTFLRVFVQLFVTALFFVVTAQGAHQLDQSRASRDRSPSSSTTRPSRCSRPIRRFLPQSGMIDLSPMILGMVLLILMRVLLLR